MQITPPPMPEPFGYVWHEGEISVIGYSAGFGFSHDEPADYGAAPVYDDDQLAARDALWLAIVKDAVEREREACAKACEELELKERISGQWTGGWCEGTDDCAAAIRSRSATEVKEPQQ
ncbi:hypothetical protein [Flavobacterium sp.]|jgi:hypothetical protein|uniref:hypothetical protein n=1 Tax=Flavobacterium sp. TaxID=239 RepID=UPI0037BE6E3C